MQPVAPFLRLIAIVTVCGLATPAWAAPGGTPVDEPAALAILALGVTGLIVGRHVARRRD